MRHAVAFVSLLVLTAPAWAAAADAPPPAATDERARFKAAQDLFDKGKFAAALPLFRAIEGPNATFYVGLCLRELKQLPEAYEELTRAIRGAAARAATEPRYAATRDAASTERAGLTAKIGLVVIAVTDRPAGLQVKVAGHLVAPERLGEAVPVEPGPVLIEASAPGRVPFQRELALGAGASEVLAIALPATTAATAPTPLATAPRATTGGGVRTAGYVVAGLGVAGFATFAITGLLATSKYNEVAKACGNTHCTDPTYSSQIGAGRTLDTMANVGLAAGIAGVTGGALMILLGGPRAGSPAPVAVAASPAGARLVVQGRF
jgi:hypothetical protein